MPPLASSPATDPPITGTKQHRIMPLRCSVSFNLSSAPCPDERICSIDRWDNSDIEGLWIQRHDYERIRQEGLAVLREIATGKPSGANRGDNHCFRGLESCTKSGATQKRRNRNAALNAVLFEQELQRARNVTDPESIARAYLHYSRDCEENASLRGLHDERQIQEQKKVIPQRPRKVLPRLNIDRPPIKVTRSKTY